MIPLGLKVKFFLYRSSRGKDIFVPLGGLVGRCFLMLLSQAKALSNINLMPLVY